MAAVTLCGRVRPPMHTNPASLPILFFALVWRRPRRLRAIANLKIMGNTDAHRWVLAHLEEKCTLKRYVPIVLFSWLCIYVCTVLQPCYIKFLCLILLLFYVLFRVYSMLLYTYEFCNLYSLKNVFGSGWSSTNISSLRTTQRRKSFIIKSLNPLLFRTYCPC
jgi:hypothetical protein